MFRYTDSMSNLSMRAAGPNFETILITFVIYFNVLEMPEIRVNSITDTAALWKIQGSTIRRHFPGCPFFGITPKLKNHSVFKRQLPMKQYILKNHSSLDAIQIGVYVWVDLIGRLA